jgi:hypothetical protein
LSFVQIFTFKYLHFILYQFCMISQWKQILREKLKIKDKVFSKIRIWFYISLEVSTNFVVFFL